MSECIQIALERNLDVKVARYGPEIAREHVSLAYGAYEPTFDISGTHSYSISPGGIDPQNRPFAGTTTEGESYQAGLTGLLPTGLILDLGGDITGKSGVSGSGPFENADGSASIRMRQPLLRNFWIDNVRATIQVSKKQLKMSELAFRQQIMAVQLLQIGRQQMVGLVDPRLSHGGQEAFPLLHFRRSERAKWAAFHRLHRRYRPSLGHLADADATLCRING